MPRFAHPTGAAAVLHPLSPRAGAQTDRLPSPARSSVRLCLPFAAPRESHHVMGLGRTQVEKYSRLSQAVLANHTAQRYDADSLALNAKLLELNPEVYSAWNFRKRCLAALLPTLARADGIVALEKELQLVHALHSTALPLGFGWLARCRRPPGEYGVYGGHGC